MELAAARLATEGLDNLDGDGGTASIDADLLCPRTEAVKAWI
jgi:hypothetical protein